MTRDNVLPIFSPPTLADCENAISRALLRIRSNGLCMTQIAKALNCSAGTIENASNAKSLLNFESVALLAFHFPEEFALIEGLWTFRAAVALTPIDRIARIEGDISAIRKEFAA
jgi:hypothetical protein